MATAGSQVLAPRCIANVVANFELKTQVALLTRRVFLIDYTRPEPLEGVLQPRLLNWSVPTGLVHPDGRDHITCISGDCADEL